MQSHDTFLTLMTPYDFSTIEPYKKLFEDAIEIKLHSSSGYSELTFQYSKSFNYHIIFSNPPNLVLPTQSFSLQEFFDFITLFDKVILYFNKDITCDLPEDLFKIEKVEVVNYPDTITELEKRSLVKCRPSKSWMTTDGRCFKIVSQDTLNKEEWWEVDILGTPYGKDICHKIVHLWKSIVAT